MFKSLPKSLAAVGLAVTVALTGTFASTTEARADRDDLRTFLGAAAGIVVLGNILNDRHNRTHYYAPAPVTRYVAPPATHYVVPQVIVPNLVAPVPATAVSRARMSICAPSVPIVCSSTCPIMRPCPAAAANASSPIRAGAMSTMRNAFTAMAGFGPNG